MTMFLNFLAGIVFDGLTTLSLMNRITIDRYRVADELEQQSASLE